MRMNLRAGVSFCYLGNSGLLVGERRRGVPPMFFARADSKGLAGEKRVSAESKGLKVLCFDAVRGWSASAENKGLGIRQNAKASWSVEQQRGKLVQRIHMQG